MKRESFYERDNILIFDPTNYSPINVVPNCSKVNHVLSFFRNAWNKIQMSVSSIEFLCENITDESAVKETIDKEFLSFFPDNQNIITSIFGIEDYNFATNNN